jgi:FAD dependent oxidoreductase
MFKVSHNFDFCVVGGGVAGICAAMSAARQGIKTAIIQDRPIFGGNSSSEIRMHISGADRSGELPNLRETGILEELRLENLRRNPQQSYSVWDSILYQKIKAEPNIESFLNCSCLDVEMDGDKILSVTGWQLTTETYHTIKSKIFADCSGDGILAPMTGAQFRMGREAQDEFDESIAPEIADDKTMGMTLMFAAKDTGKPQSFRPPSWAHTFKTDDDLPSGATEHDKYIKMGYWWIELGGEKYHSIHDTEKIRDELLKIVYGVWDHIKNHGDHGAENWALDWVQFLPGKRESRRYVGAHILSQKEIGSGGRFDDVVAYGGWTMDDHDPGGFWSLKTSRPSTIFHPCPSPYGIPLRSLYSKNIKNLMFAGRCISATHAAMSSTRVMGSAAVMGQAVGTAAAIAIKKNILPSGISKNLVDDLQQSLLNQDCYLPGVTQKFSDINTSIELSATSGSAQPLLDGTNRPVGNDPHCWEGRLGDSLEYRWSQQQKISHLTLIFDSDLSTSIAFSHLYYPEKRITEVPPQLVKDFQIEILDDNGEWQLFRSIEGNYQRFVTLAVNKQTTGIRAIFKTTWGAEKVRLYAFYID